MAGEQYIRCPATLITQEEHELVMVWYRHYRNGMVPVAGGLLDQANYYIEAMAYIDRIIHG